MADSLKTLRIRAGLVLLSIVVLVLLLGAVIVYIVKTDKDYIDRKADCIEKGGTWVTSEPEWLSTDGKCAFPEKT